jgi:hypothetical protein
MFYKPTRLFTQSWSEMTNIPLTTPKDGDTSASTPASEEQPTTGGYFLTDGILDIPRMTEALNLLYPSCTVNWGSVLNGTHIIAGTSGLKNTLSEKKPSLFRKF